MFRIINLLLAMLRGAGLHCERSFPRSRLPRLKSPLTCVSVSDFVRVPAAVDSFVGTDTSGRGCLGYRESFSALLDIFFPYQGGGEGCPEYIEQVLYLLASGFSELTAERVSVTPLTFDPDTDCYRCTISAVLSAVVCQPIETQ